MAKWARPALLGRKMADDAEEHSVALMKLTRTEVELGEARGPFTAEEMDQRHPGGWLAAPRFAVVQKAVRPCDDYAVFGHNSSSQTEETVDCHGPDSIVGVARLWTQSVKDDGTVLVQAGDQTLEGVLHPELARPESRSLKARIVDLRRAYKQAKRHPKNAATSVFALFFQKVWTSLKH